MYAYQAYDDEMDSFMAKANNYWMDICENISISQWNQCSMFEDMISRALFNLRYDDNHNLPEDEYLPWEVRKMHQRQSKEPRQVYSQSLTRH